MSLFSPAVGAFNTTRTNHTLVCLPDPFTDVQGQPFSLLLTLLLPPPNVDALLPAWVALQHSTRSTASTPCCIKPAWSMTCMQEVCPSLQFWASSPA